MKNITLLLLFALAGFSVSAQITYESTDFATQGETHVVSEATAGISSFDFAATGANYSWSYPTLPISTQEEISWIDPNNSGYKTSWCLTNAYVLNCNTQFNNNFNLATQLQEGFEIQGYGLTNIYAHYKLSSTNVQAKMIGADISTGSVTVPFVMSYTQPDVLYQFPMNYLNTDSSNSSIGIDLSTFGLPVQYSQDAQRTNVVEGWGSLVTPFGTFASVLKVKTTVVSTQNVTIQGQMQSVTSTSVSYKWFDKAYGIPVLEAEGELISGVWIPTRVTYIDNLQCLEPLAAFGYLPVVPDVDPTTQSVTVSFINAGNNYQEALWDFGDDTTSTEENPEHTYTCPGTKMVTLTLTNTFCEPDMVDTITLPVVITDTQDVYTDEVTLSGNTLTANRTTTGTTYQWVDCNNNQQAVSGATAQSYTPTQSGSYAVMLTTNGCQSVSDCVTITINPVMQVPVLVDVTAQCLATPEIPTTTNSCGDTISGTTTTTFPITTQGTTMVTWTFTDCDSSVQTANQNIIIDDTVVPVAPTLENITAQCSATPTAPVATDACAGTITGATTTSFPITTQGTTVVTWTFNDGNGNTSSATQSVIIDDTVAPVAPTLETITAQCSATPTAPVATDACAGTITGTTTTSFPITTQGTTVVTWIFNDGNGNTSTATQSVIIEDTVAPVAPTLETITAQCSATPTAPVATDACAGNITGTTTTSFPITTQGTTVVTWIFNDGNGNTSTATQSVIIEDTVAPVAPTLETITAQCSATPTAPVATDACAGNITGTTTTSFPITTQGTTLVTWIFNDGNGNTSTATQSVIIDDTVAPVAPTLETITAQCSATPTAPVATDACAGTITGTTTTTFPITTQGTTEVIWIFNDGNGNTSTATQSVIIDDTVAPVAPTLENITAQCSATPTAPIATDACAGTITGTTTTSFPITTQGTTVVTWTFNDGNGNTSSTTQSVIIDDTVAPVAPTLETITAQCSATPTAPVATDACAGNITGTTTTSFPITTQGTTEVIWTFNDGNGNTSTATQSVIIEGIDNSVITEGTTLIAGALGVSYQWNDCSTGQPIAGATEQTYSPEQPGSYSVTVSNSECEAVSDCVTIEILSTPVVVKSNITLYPNPVRDIFYIQADVPVQSVTVYKLLGQPVAYNTDLTVQASGCYIVKVVLKNGTVHEQKILKQ